MTYTLSLILWMATAQPATVTGQYVPSDTERALRAQLDEARAQIDQARAQLDEARAQIEEARAQLAKTKEESRLPDNAVATLLLSDRPELASLQRLSQRVVGRGPQRMRFDVYGSTREGVTLVAVVVNLKNPRDQKTWEPTEASVSVPFGPKTFASFGLRAPWFPPQAVAVRSAPERILPGQSARVAVVFDKADLEEANGPVKVELRRDGKSDLEFELHASEVWPEAESER